MPLTLLSLLIPLCKNVYSLDFTFAPNSNDYSRIHFSSPVSSSPKNCTQWQQFLSWEETKECKRWKKYNVRKFFFIFATDFIVKTSLVFHSSLLPVESIGKNIGIELAFSPFDVSPLHSLLCVRFVLPFYPYFSTKWRFNVLR